MGVPLSPWDLPGVPENDVGITNVSLIISEIATVGWTEQVSPACAAASVAGAFNGLLQAQKNGTNLTLSRHQSKHVVHQKHILKHYAKHAERELGDAKGALATLLRIEEEDLGGLSGAIYHHPVLKQALEEIKHASDSRHVRGQREHSLLHALHAVAGLPPASGNGVFTNTELDEALSDAAQRARRTKIPTHVAHALSSSLTHNKGKTEEAVHRYLLAEADLYDITADEASGEFLVPSTSSVGTEKWYAALLDEDLAQQFGLPKLALTPVLSSSANDQPLHLVTPEDASGALDAQWQSIELAVGSKEGLLLYHMPDHYSLVHAARSWTVSSPYGGLDAPGGRTRKIRQILVGKPGQMPSTWLDFEWDVLQDLYDSLEYALVELALPAQ
eukprot:jgi/Botrbrau1/3007/Bobra.0070s0005.1